MVVICSTDYDSALVEPAVNSSSKIVDACEIDISRQRLPSTKGCTIGAEIFSYFIIYLKILDYYI